jgi:hypothetical protein
LARRLCGVNPINWYPQSPRAIRSMPMPALMPFTIIMLGKGQDASEYSEWVKSSEVSPTIVAEKNGDLGYNDLTIEGLQRRFLKVCEALPSSIEHDLKQQATTAIESWAPLPRRSLGFTVGGHATVTPNLMALAACGFEEMVHGRFENINEGIKPYVDQIITTSRSVLEERDRIDTSAMEGNVSADACH